MVINTPDFTVNKYVNVSEGVTEETLLDTPVTLPTSEPVTPQVQYTVTLDNLPITYPAPYQITCMGYVIGAGRFVTAGTLSWRMKKNGVSVATGTFSVTANYYYTTQAFFLGVTVGDLLEIALWSSVTNSNYDYKALQVQPTRVLIFPPKHILIPLNFAELAILPSLSLGNPYGMGGRPLRIYHLDYELVGISVPTVFETMYPKGTYGMWRLEYGDYTNPDTAVVSIHATFRPYYNRNRIPFLIRFRGLRVI